jgi:hypothetical protein
MREFVEITKAVGKTIEGVRLCEEQGYEVLVVVFTDGTYSCASHWFDDSGMHILDFSVTDIPLKAATRLGIATNDEYQQALREAGAKSLKDQEDRDRKEYRRLKAKFEGGK